MLIGRVLFYLYIQLAFLLDIYNCTCTAEQQQYSLCYNHLDVRTLPPFIYEKVFTEHEYGVKKLSTKTKLKNVILWTEKNSVLIKHAHIEICMWMYDDCAATTVAVSETENITNNNDVQQREQRPNEWTKNHDEIQLCAIHEHFNSEIPSPHNSICISKIICGIEEEYKPNNESKNVNKKAKNCNNYDNKIL